MSKFNTRRTVRSGVGPITATREPGETTYEGAQAYSRDWRSELFLLAVTNMVGEATAYESGNERNDRYSALVRHGAVTDPEWTRDLLVWLRTDVHLRSAALVGGIEFTVARIEAGLHGYSRQIINTVLQRPDEALEAFAYWNATYGQRKQPKPFKRGVADAVRRMWNERAVLKWDSAAKPLRFANVLEIVHPAPVDDKQRALFKYILDRRRDWAQIPDELPMLQEHEQLMSMPVERRRSMLDAEGASVLQRAGVTWEALSGWLQGPLDAEAWEAVIPSMGYMALLRNLRNFDEAGVSDKVASLVADKLADRDEVLKSRQMPMRFLSAYNAAPSLRWAWPLEKALNHSLDNFPSLSGRTLILIDTSGSMRGGFSRDGSLKRWDAAAMFGIALATRCGPGVDVVSFSDTSKVFPMEPGVSVLKHLERFNRDGYFIGMGTKTANAVEKHYQGHDRVVILTDEQAYGGGWINPRFRGREITDLVPANVPLHTFNLAGYEYGHTPTGPNRYTWGGLTDACFRLIPIVESGKNGDWPWKN